MKCLNTWDWVALIILFIGGLNWGLVGIFNLDLVSWIFGEMTALTRIVYAVVGISSIYVLVSAFSWGKE